MLRNFWKDESGFLVSSELILIFTVMVLGLIVGMVEVQFAVIGELNDVSDALGSLNMSYSTSGFTAVKGISSGGQTFKAQTFGSVFHDTTDICDANQCTLGCDVPVPETTKT